MSHQCRQRKPRETPGDPELHLSRHHLSPHQEEEVEEDEGQEASQTWGQLGLARIGGRDK